MLTWLRELAATVGSFDRSSLEPGWALRCTLGVAIPLVVATRLGNPSLGVAAAIGAFITGFTSLQGVYRTRLQAVLIAALGMAVTSFIGALAAHSTPGLIAATALAAYACATIGQLGPAAATVSLNSLIAFVLFSSQALAPAAALEQSALVLGGGLIQTLLLLAALPTARLSVERAALADVYAKLAAYARPIAGGGSPLPPMTPLATARQVLADPQPFASSAERARFDRLLEDSEVIRKRLAAFAEAGVVPGGVAERLDAVAAILRGRGAGEAVEVPEVADGDDLDSYVRDATLAAAMLSGGRVPKFQLLSQPRPGPYVENQIAWLSRDSLRFALVLAIAMVLGRHFSADRGYWIPMTAAIVLKPDFQTTFVRGAARIGGTLIGAVVATLALTLVRGHATLQNAAILASTLAAYATFYPNYALFTVAITTFVVLVLGMRGLPGTTTIDARVLDTLVGGSLAMFAYLALPTWEQKRSRALLADLLEAQRALAGAILRAYAEPSPQARAAIDAARTAVWQARTAAEASIDRSRHEPQRPHTIAVGRALRILATTQRLGLATLALEAMLESGRRAADAAAIGRFAGALDARMAELAAALRESRRAPSDDRLRAAAAGVAGESSFFTDRVRSYVDAAARLARLVGVERSGKPA